MSFVIYQKISILTYYKELLKLAFCHSYLFFYYLCKMFMSNNNNMSAKKILFITQEITPYVSESELSLIGQNLPQAIQDKGYEIRTFMPKWGNVNERRNQLHEVIRLSGMNIIIDDTDHPLIIKVASIQSARRQVYFIDNDDYFLHRLMTADEEGNEYEDNGERAIFYARGVLETVKKLRWCPDVIHCHGWMSAVVPLFIKKAYQDEPSFRDSKVVFSVYGNGPKANLAPNFKEQVLYRDITLDDLKMVDTPANYEELCKLAIAYSDGVVQNSENVNQGIMDYAKGLNLPVVDFQTGDAYADACQDLYNKILVDAD